NGDRPADLSAANDDGPLDGWTDTDVGLSAATSHLPAGLTASNGLGDGGSGFGLATLYPSTELDNYIYSGPTSPTTRSAWIARITTATNWSGTDTGPYNLQADGSLGLANYQITGPLSNNADLSALSTTAGSITFSAATTAYAVNVANATTTTTVTATRAEANATLEVRVNGGSYTALTSGVASSALPLNVGANPIDVRVTAQDGTTIKTYTITVTRAAVPPNLTINDVTQSEGNSGTTTFSFTVSLSAPAPAGGVTFDIATANGTATQPGDYTQTSQTSQTIAAGNSTFTFNVPVLGDTAVETNETFFVNVTNITGATALDAQGLGTITNDDVATPPTITSVSPASGPIAGGTTVVITGTGFTGATAVNFGTTPATGFTVNSPTQITATLPAGTGGIFDISVVTGTGTATGSGLFYYFTTTGGTPAVAASKVDIFTPNGAGKVLPGAPIQYRTLIANTGAGDATTVDFADAIPANTTLVPGSVNVSPLAEDNSYATIVNTQLAAGAPTVLSGPLVTSATKVTDNDREFLADTFTISAFDATSANGGSVVMVTSGPNMGSFTYVPAAGFVGVDSFTYTLRDDGTDSTASNADDLTGIGIVTITVNEADNVVSGTQKVWYIDSGYAGANGVADGTSARPFTSMTSVSGATGPDAVGDTLYVATGTSNYGFFAFLLDQTLWGANNALILNGVTLATASAKPVFENAGGAAITLSGAGGTNTIRGISVANSAIASNNGSGAFGTLVISNTTMTGTSRKLDLANGTVNGTIDSLTATNGVNGVSLTNVNGTLTITAGAISGTSGDDFSVSGGTAVISYGGTITNSAGRSVNVANKTGGSVTFSGSITDTVGSTGVSLTSNTGSTISFTGGLSVSTGTSAAFSATGGGTVNVTGANNTLTTTTGTALNVANTTIGASGLNFRSISANGAVNGIVLSSTGSSGGLTVTGTGNTTLGGNASGGTIQSTTGAGILLTNTQNVSLTNVTIQNTAD
ncbi:MAG: cadherin-like beta sandwich domain-containing protein, partial [Verrucomicrobiaceae bacterium]|nr:cadherin-like beta sandwich domain-containing protein [Verrucomicrobiaceae bacterium]